MSTVTPPAAAAWPTNLGAYRRVLAGAVAGLVPAGAVAGLDFTPATVLAAAAGAAGNVAVLLAGHHRAKVAATWAATVLAGAVTALAASPAVSPKLGAWDAPGLATLLALIVGSVLHTVVPNAPAVLPDPATAAAAGVPAGVQVRQAPQVTVPAAPGAAAGGMPLPVESVTAALAAINPTPVTPVEQPAGGAA